MEKCNSTEDSMLSECPGLQEKFDSYCEAVGLTDLKANVWNVILELAYGLDQQPEEELYLPWFCAASYMAGIDAVMPYGPGDPHLEDQSPPLASLSQLLITAHMNVIQFIELMRKLREEITFSEAVRTHLSTVEKRYCITSPLFDRFDREWGTVFREEESTENGLEPETVSRVEDKKGLCWTLFLLARDGVLGDNHELIHTYHLLLSCVEFVLRTTPSFQLQEPFDMLHLKASEHMDQNGYNVAIVEKLAEKFHTSFEDLQNVQSLTEPFFQTLCNKSGNMQLSKLQDLYTNSYKKNGGLDELQFLSRHPHLFLKTNSGVRTNSIVTQSPCDTPVTPVRAALNTIQQLKSLLATSRDVPSPELLQYFKACSTNPEKSILERLALLKSRFIAEYTKVMGEKHITMAEERFQQALKLYFRVMRTLLDMEKERLSQADFSQLLSYDTFHKSLLACAVEIVLMTYNVTWNASKGAMGTDQSQLVFPWIVEVFSLYPYDFYKVLESFIKAEANLTREIIRHLTTIENKILDQIAWKSGSPVFEALSQEAEPVCTDPPVSATSNATELYWSPVKGGHRTTGGSHCVVFASPKKFAPSPRKQGQLTPKGSPDPKANGGRRSRSLTMFFNKVCRLGYNRLISLCEMFHVPKDVQQKVWTCFEFCITHKTNLIKDRHLDQIMMCSMYGICRVSENEIKFKDIVREYRKLPHTEEETCREVLLEGQERANIVSFYNKVYMPNLKDFLLRFAKQQQPNLSPSPKTVNSPVYSMPGHKNFYLSPLKESPFKSPPSPANMTPRSRQLYSFGDGFGSSSQALRNINETLSAFKVKNARPSSTPRSLKRLSFDGPEDANQNSPGSSSDETTPIPVKKKKVTPPDAIQKSPIETRRNSKKGGDKNDNIR